MPRFRKSFHEKQLRRRQHVLKNSARFNEGLLHRSSIIDVRWAKFGCIKHARGDPLPTATAFSCVLRLTDFPR
jgi:hypothetical protein